MRLLDQTVCFTGHRDLTAEAETALSPLLDRLLEHTYQLGYRRFFSGAARGFDLFAAERVAQLQKRHSDVRLLLAVPFAAQTRGWRDADLRRYAHVLCLSDDTRVLSPHYYQGCLHVRNRYMVDRAALCICYLNKMKGGTMSAVAYAVQKDVPLVNLAMPGMADRFIQENRVAPRE